MNTPKGYMTGVNLGGWISQYGNKGIPHYDSFITEKTIRRTAELGFDHLRLPVDDPIIEESPFKAWDKGIAYIDSCLAWCKKYGLNLILDLHAAPGYFFGTLKENTLFEDPVMQDRFIWIWEFFAKRYINERDNLVFELVNEMVEPDSTRWNRLAHRAIAAIRAIDPDRWIVFGGNNYNAITELKNIDILPDDNKIIYTFHFYEPIVLTHQKAPWCKGAREYTADKELFYPGTFPGIQEFVEQNPNLEDSHGLERFIGKTDDKAFLLELLKPAEEFIQKTGKPVYCGEYGMYDGCSHEAKVNWVRDLTDWFEKMGIGRAVWSLINMSFGIVGDDEPHTVRDQPYCDQVTRHY